MKKNNFMKAIAATLVATLFLTACDPEGTAEKLFGADIILFRRPQFERGPTDGLHQGI